MKYQDFLPPILVRSLEKLFLSKAEAPSPNLFSSYVEAQEACYGAGYEDSKLVETIFEKTKLIKDPMLSRSFPLSESVVQSLLAGLFSLRCNPLEKQLKVVDFGGACGAHYFQIRPFIPPDIQLTWIVVETPAMVEKARALETIELCFVASIFEAKERLQSVDLLHSSGALQYVVDPGTTIQAFMDCEPAYIFMNRLALSASETFITIQESFLSANGPGTLPEGSRDRLCRYPVTFFPKHHLTEMLSQRYQRITEFVDTKSMLAGKEIYVNTCIFAERFR